MRVNVYAEELTDKVEFIKKKNDEGEWTGVRFYLELPVTHKDRNISGPFIHRDGDDDSSAITFWGKRDLHKLLKKALKLMDDRYGPIKDE